MRRAQFFEGARTYFENKRTGTGDNRWRSPIALVEGSFVADEGTIFVSSLVAARSASPLYHTLLVSSAPDSYESDHVVRRIDSPIGRTLYHPESGLLEVPAVPILLNDERRAIPHDVVLSLTDPAVQSRIGERILVATVTTF